MQNEQQCREAFHSWYKDPDNPRALRRSDSNPDGYALMQVQLSWEAWKACWNARPAAKTEVTDEMVERAKWGIAAVFVPDGIYNIEEGWKLERAAREALEAALSTPPALNGAVT